MQGTLGQSGFGTKKRDYATAPKGGGRVQRFTRRGRQAPGCPAGARSVSTGTYGTGSSTTAYNDCELAAPRPAPVAAPPPPPPAPDISVQVSPAIQTQVSPQISPVFTQMQDSPGAGVVAAPQQIAPAPMTAAPAMGPAFDPVQERERIRREMEVERILAEDERRQQTEREAAERYAAAESERTRFAEEQQAAEQQAREDAQSRQAADSGGIPSALPAYLPTVGPSAPMPYTEPSGAVATAETREEGTNLLPLLLAAAVGVGALMLTKGKRKGRKR